MFGRTGEAFARGQVGTAANDRAGIGIGIAHGNIRNGYISCIFHRKSIGEYFPDGMIYLSCRISLFCNCKRRQLSYHRYHNLIADSRNGIAIRIEAVRRGNICYLSGIHISLRNGMLCRTCKAFARSKIGAVANDGAGIGIGIAYCNIR